MNTRRARLVCSQVLMTKIRHQYLASYWQNRHYTKPDSEKLKYQRRTIVRRSLQGTRNRRKKNHK